MEPQNGIFEHILDDAKGRLVFESDPETTGSPAVKDAKPLSEDDLNSLQEFVAICAGSELVCRPLLPACLIDGIYQKNGVYFEVDCIWSDAKENNCITVTRVSQEYAEQKSEEIKKTDEILSQDSSLDPFIVQEVCLQDHPENFREAEINRYFTAIYKRPEQKENLDNIGNFYRQKSIHNDIVRTIERMKSEKIDFGNIKDFQSDHFKIEVLVKELLSGE